jgi:hypothetical protein
MIKWEYCIVLETRQYVSGKLHTSALLIQLDSPSLPRKEGVELFLEDLGAQGWELVEITAFDPTAHVQNKSPIKYFFKRPVP